MKKTMFAALVAAVAMLATSCAKELPKALFTYEVSELTVTFTNLSQNADSYTWNFGDGQTSTEKSPVHTYAENGSYTVVLTAANKDGEAQFSESIVMKTAAIKIDGNFADWDALIAKGGADVAALENGKEYYKSKLYKTAWYTDEDFIYMYFEYDAAETAPLDVLIGTTMTEDETAATHLWTPCYVDYDLEFGNEGTGDWTDWKVNMLYNYDHATGGWSFPTVAAENPVELVKGDGKMEGRMSRAYFNFTNTYFTIGAFNSNADWSEIGTLPAAEMVDGAAVYPEMMKVRLN